MFGFGKKNKIIAEAAKSVARQINDSFPPPLLVQLRSSNSKISTKAERQYKRMLTKAIQQVKQVKATNHLKVYGKAKFHQQLIQQLVECGYEHEFSGDLSGAILLESP